MNVNIKIEAEYYSSEKAMYCMNCSSVLRFDDSTDHLAADRAN